MHDNKVSEKAIWEGSITPDNDNPSFASQMQSQPQMMFCYKCNQVIPGNSTFCPYCQVKLFTECPKCGAKYSSQYPACSQCGTNREGYLRAQRQEQERKRVIEAENRRQREIAEQKKIEEERRRKEAEEERERQERFKKYQQEANERQQKEAYLKENAEIMKTKEYETAYSLLNKAFDDYEKSKNNMGCILVPLLTIIIMLTLFCVHPVLGFILLIVLPPLTPYIINDKDRCKEQLQKFVSSSKNYNNQMLTVLIDMVSYQGRERLSDCCIIAYRRKYGLSINLKWHNLRS